MPYVELLDDSAWPIIYARFRGTATIADYDVYARWYEAQLARALAEGTRVIAISDTTPGVSVSSDVRRHITSWMTALDQTPAARASLANLVVIDGLVIRGVLTAIGWVMGSRMNVVTTVASVEAAWDGATTTLSEAGMTPATTKPAWLKSKAS